MKKKMKKKKNQVMISLAVPMETGVHLDYLVSMFAAYRPQLTDYPYKRVNRSQVIRMALAYLQHQAELGNVGPELLNRVGTDRRVGTVYLGRRR